MDDRQPSETKTSDVDKSDSALVKSSAFLRATVIDDESPCRLIARTITSLMI